MSSEDKKAPQLSEYSNNLDPLVKNNIGVDLLLICGKTYDVDCLSPILVLETSYYYELLLGAIQGLQKPAGL